MGLEFAWIPTIPLGSARNTWGRVKYCHSPKYFCAELFLRCQQHEQVQPNLEFHQGTCLEPLQQELQGQLSCLVWVSGDDHAMDLVGGWQNRRLPDCLPNVKCFFLRLPRSLPHPREYNHFQGEIVYDFWYPCLCAEKPLVAKWSDIIFISSSVIILDLHRSCKNGITQISSHDYSWQHPKKKKKKCARQAFPNWL